MGSLMPDYAFPQKSAPLSKGEHGVASLTHGGRTFRFRTNPNEFKWTYTLNKRIDQTYGGRVVQLLGTKIDDFVLKADAGRGGWDYVNRFSSYLRDIMVNQRNGSPATFEYTTRGWKLNAYIVSVPFADAVTEVLREFEITMKVQEDVSGLISKNSLDGELRALSNGIGFRRSRYNDPLLANQQMVDIVGDFQGAIEATIDAATGIIQIPTVSEFLPNGLNLPGVNNGAPSIGRN